MIYVKASFSKKVIACGVVLLALLIFVSVCGVHKMVTSGNLLQDSKNTIIIDAGHGGIDPGAIGVNGEEEKQINLSIACVLGNMLSCSGYNVIYTRLEDVSLHSGEESTVKGIKSSDLKNRLKLFNNYPDAIVISIHQNKFSDGKYSGAQMFYGKNEQSKLLAESIQSSIKGKLQPNNSRVVKPITSDVYIINNAKNPAVLAECGFLSNKEECEKLADKEYQAEIAFCIYAGILEYCK